MFDIVFSLTALLVLFPLMIATGILVKLTSPGPVLYRQKRLTKDMRVFTIYKFRSMRADFDTEAKGIQIRSTSDVITPFGRFLRKTKLDELPQLVNILKGDMSVIGPRPELPRRLPWYSERDKEIFQVRSGVSSPASIVFSDEEYLMNQVSDPEKFYREQIMPYKIDLNLYYVKTRTFRGDLWLMLATVLKMAGFIKNENVVRDRELLRRKEEIVEKSE